MNTKFSPTAAPHARKNMPQAYFILRALYAGKNHTTLSELALQEGLAPGTISKRPRIYRRISAWCTRRRVKGKLAYVYSRIPGKTKDEVLKEFREGLLKVT